MSDRFRHNFLLRRDFLQLKRLAKEAQRNDHSEVCGLLGIDRKRRIYLFFLANKSRRPGSYRLTEKQIASGCKKIASLGLSEFGSFHSHPITEAKPGLGDLERGFYKGIELIYDVIGDEARLWKLGRGGAATELSLRIQTVVKKKKKLLKR